jgi:hypothetical protein
MSVQGMRSFFDARLKLFEIKSFVSSIDNRQEKKILEKTCRCNIKKS